MDSEYVVMALITAGVRELAARLVTNSISEADAEAELDRIAMEVGKKILKKVFDEIDE